MKKIISIILMITMLLSLCMTLSFAESGEYNTCDENEKHAVENIEHYFVPEAYDVSPFTGYSYWDPILLVSFDLTSISCEEFYDKKVVYNEDGKIIVPPIYTLFENIDTDCDTEYKSYNTNMWTMMQLYNYGDNNKHGLSLTDSMWKVLNDNVSLENAISVFISPWTLYNEGNLYSWKELMAMNEDELEKLNFESYEFYTFITGVKEALISRGWWKDEYQAKYDILNSHRNDYPNAQLENETFEMDGKTVYFSRINEEYLSNNSKSPNNIISVNIYKPEFAEILIGLDVEVREKYFETVTAIEKQLEFDFYELSMEWGREHYQDPYQTEFAPNAVACEAARSNINYLLSLDESDLSETEKQRRACERYNYIASAGGTLGSETVEVIVNGTAKERVDYFLYDTSVVIYYNNNGRLGILPWWRFAAKDWSNGYFDEELGRIDDYDRVIERLEYLYKNVDSGSNSQTFRNNIDYLKAYAEKAETPETGENTVLYIAIAGAAVVAMTALLVRKKREIV